MGVYKQDPQLEIENRLSKKVLNCAFTVHTQLGPGLLESAYQMAMEIELFRSNIPYVSQKALSLHYKGHELETAYRADFIIGDKLVVELKSVEGLHDIHLAQMLTYQKLAECRLGLLLNFNVKLLKHGIKRVIL